MVDVTEDPPVADLTNFRDVVDDKPIETPEEELGPMYRVVGATKIPVSKKLGKRRKSQLDQARAAMEKNEKAWREAIRYYHNDHSRDSTGTGYDDNSDASNASASGMRGARGTENIVFANVSALVPMLYTKNPDAEFTAQSEDTKQLSDLLEKLMKKLAGQKSSPGLNLKRKMKRAIVLTTLCNCAWLEVGYTKRDQSSDQALADLTELSGRYEKAKNTKEIKEIEGGLLALESKIDMLTPSGPWVKLRKPWEVFVDGAATELDLSDATVVMIKDMIPTQLLQALYGKKDEETGEWMSVYEPTHVLKASTNAEGENLQNDNFVLFAKDSNHSQYGYNDENSYKAAQLTCVYYVWDKATRRCELYSDADWKWPIWVWDDPYKLDQFFPLVPLEFHTDPVKMYAKGEVTYYLDQQDALNLINNEFERIRAYATSLVGYDKNTIKDPAELEAILNGTYNKKSIGFDLPEGKKIGDILGAVLPVSAQVLPLFDKKPLLESIDRVSGVTSVQRGVEYKTNTTNRAIESYESQQQTRADEKMDAIEECVGGVLWLVAQMCLQFMSEAEVAALIGDATGWVSIEPRDIPIKFTPKVVGGSSVKPTSAAKKQQALQMSQILGQFAKASPVAILIAVKVLQSAFSNELVMEESDWGMLAESVQQMMQAQQQQAAGAAGAQQQQGAQGGAPQQPQGGGEGDQAQVVNVIQQAVAQAAELIDKLPPDMKVKIGVMLARQTPMQEIAQTIISGLDQQG